MTMIELIDKNKAIKKLAFAQEQMYKAIGGVEDDTHKTLDTIQFCIDRIDEIEAEKVEIIKHGQWVIKNGRGYCSECNQSYDILGGTIFNYCPNCGAKMIDF